MSRFKFQRVRISIPFLLVTIVLGTAVAAFVSVNGTFTAPASSPIAQGDTNSTSIGVEETSTKIVVVTTDSPTTISGQITTTTTTKSELFNFYSEKTIAASTLTATTLTYVTMTETWYYSTSTIDTTQTLTNTTTAVTTLTTTRTSIQDTTLTTTVTCKNGHNCQIVSVK